jgi:hypothetical protein
MLLLIKRVVGITFGGEGVKRTAAVIIQGKTFLNPHRQIRVGEKVASKRNQIGVALLYNLFGRVSFKASCCNDLSFEYLSQFLCCDRALTFLDDYLSFDTGFNNVDLSKPKPIELCSEVSEQRFGIAVGHVIPAPTRPNAHCYPVAAPYRRHGFDNLKQETAPILDRSSILICTLVAAVLQELVR